MVAQDVSGEGPLGPRMKEVRRCWEVRPSEVHARQDDGPAQLRDVVACLEDLATVLVGHRLLWCRRVGDRQGLVMVLFRPVDGSGPRAGDHHAHRDQVVVHHGLAFLTEADLFVDPILEVADDLRALSVVDLDEDPNLVVVFHPALAAFLPFPAARVGRTDPVAVALSRLGQGPSMDPVSVVAAVRLAVDLYSNMRLVLDYLLLCRRDCIHRPLRIF